MNILIFEQSRALGDGMMFSGIPKKIVELYPGTSVDIFCTKTFGQAYKNNEYVRNLYFFKTYTTFWRNVPQEKLIYNFLWQLPVLMKARNNLYDLIIDSYSLYNPSNLKMLQFLKKSNSAQILGRFRTDNIYGQTRESLSKIYSQLSDKDNAFEFIGISERPPYDLHIPNENLGRAESYFNSFKNKYGENIKIVIFNGEGSGKKTISSNKIIKTIRTILEKDENIFIFCMGYKPCMAKYLKILNTLSSQRVHITYRTSFNDSCALIKYADLLISVDTALIHIASATGTNVVEIYSQNMPKYTPCFPEFVDFRVIKQTLNLDKFDMDGFSENEVYEAVSELLY